MQDKFSARNLTKDILIFVAAAGVVIPLVAIAPGLTFALKPLLNQDYKPSRINQTLKRLQKQKLISISEEEGKTKIVLSDKGKKRILRYKVHDLKLEQKKWDGWWRVIIFDIPEKKRTARDFLRSKLKELGFYKLQKSVLITPWECKEIVDFVKHYYEVGEYVDIVLAKKFDKEQELKVYFGLH